MPIGCARQHVNYIFIKKQFIHRLVYLVVKYKNKWQEEMRPKFTDPALKFNMPVHTTWRGT